MRIVHVRGIYFNRPTVLIIPVSLAMFFNVYYTLSARLSIPPADRSRPSGAYLFRLPTLGT